MVPGISTIAGHLRFTHPLFPPSLYETLTLPSPFMRERGSMIRFPHKEKSLPDKFDPFLLSLTEGED